MIDQQLRSAIAAAPSSVALDNLARLTWRGHAEGHLDDGAAQALGEALEARRALFRAGAAFRSTKAASRPRRPPRSPDRAASIERRRRQAASGAMPATIAASFTVSEQAVLTVVAREVQRQGQCLLYIDAIAALAGVSRTTTQNALREARRLGLVTVVERRRPGRASLTNIVTIVDPAWRAWLRLGRGSTTGFKKFNASNTRVFRPSNEAHHFAGEERISEPHRQTIGVIKQN